MPLITETYYLSLTQDNRGILRLRCSQDDTLRTVNLKLYNNGSIFVIPSGVSASISGVKQNGAVFSKPCTISQDRESVVLQLSSDITNIDGIIVAEIVLNDGEGGRLGTSNFIIQVEKNPIRAGVVQDTETPIEYINDFIEKIQTLTARLNNLITPSGDASLAEVVDARIGILDSTTYQTLGARLNAEFQRLSNALNGVTILESTGDTTDRTSEILSKLNTYGTCKLGKGDFYVKNLVMPEDSMFVGSGNSTRVVLLVSETNTYIVKPKSGCIIENISFDGGFTGTYSELIAVSDARRHCIILDKFNDVNSENVILSNISINNFVGSAIVQRYTTGCHCKDVVINMCYAGIDISNASYDGQCANAYISNTKFGIVQNGSNFVFSNCISKDSVQHIMSDQQNTECTFSSCTFFDSSLETTSKLAILSNARSGFVFDNCMFDSSLSMTLNACDGIVIKGTNFVGSDTFAITVSNGRNTLLLITDCIADVEPTVTNAGTAARITSCYLKDGTAWSISEADIIVDDELSDESENPIQNRAVASAISEINESLDAISDPSRLADGTDLNDIMTPGTYALHTAMTYLNSPSTQNEHGILEVWDEIYSGNPYRVFQRITFAYRADRSYSEIWIRNYSNLSSTWGNWLKVGDDTDSIKSDVATLKTKANHLAYTRVNLYDSTTAKDDIAVWGDGNEHSNPGTCCSDFIDISAYKNLTIFGTTLICFYTESKKKISADTGADTRFTERTFEVPVNAVYIRISTRAAFKESVYIGDGLVNLTNVKEKYISILFVGNSLTHDSVSYVPYILSILFPEIDFSIHIFYNGGTTLASQYNRFVNDTPCANYSICENAYTWKTFWNEYTMEQVLETYKFDVVCMQDYFTFRDSFTESDLAGWNNCQSYIAAHYTGGNPLKFITLMPAPVRDNWTSQTHPTTAVVYAATVAAMKLIMKNTVADAVLPCGMGIYKAMDTSLDELGDMGHLAQDALHCQEGIPCLLQAYIVTLWILKELGLPKSIYASPLRMTTAVYDTLNVPGNNVGTGVITGTDAQNLLAQEIAIQAHKEVSRWDYSE